MSVNQEKRMTTLPADLSANLLVYTWIVGILEIYDSKTIGAAGIMIHLRILLPLCTSVFRN